MTVLQLKIQWEMVKGIYLFLVQLGQAGLTLQSKMHTDLCGGAHFYKHITDCVIVIFQIHDRHRSLLEKNGCL